MVSPKLKLDHGEHIINKAQSEFKQQHSRHRHDPFLQLGVQNHHRHSTRLIIVPTYIVGKVVSECMRASRDTDPPHPHRSPFPQ